MQCVSLLAKQESHILQYEVPRNVWVTAVHCAGIRTLGKARCRNGHSFDREDRTPRLNRWRRRTAGCQGVWIPLTTVDHPKKGTRRRYLYRLYLPIICYHLHLLTRAAAHPQSWPILNRVRQKHPNKEKIPRFLQD